MYMRAHVLMILLNDMGKRDKIRGFVEFNKFNNASAHLSYDTLLWPLLHNVFVLYDKEWFKRVTRNKLLTQKLLEQAYRYHKLRKTSSKFYRRYYDLISKFQVGLKSLLRQGLS